MAQKRMKMDKIKEILRMHFDCSLSNQQIADAVHRSKGAIFNCLKRFKESGLSWPLSDDISQSDLEDKMYPESGVGKKGVLMPDFEKIHHEHSRPHVTLDLLWQEHHQSCPEGLSRSSFYRHYASYCKKLPVEMKQIYKGGEKVFVDYSGKKLRYWCRDEKKWIEVEFFVGSWGASSYCYCETTAFQDEQSFALSHVRAFEYFGCSPKVLVPDNLKSGVIRASFYEPEINRLYGLFAQHYGAVILPARVRNPKDKAVVESNILHLQRFIFGRLRNSVFFSPATLNEAIWTLLDEFNRRPMQVYKKSRLERFEELDKPYALPLPTTRFVLTQVKTEVGVAPNYHIEFDKHFYSVPYEFVRKQVDVYQTGSVLEIYHKGQHVCRHPKKPPNFHYTTSKAHMPPKHRFAKGWSADWFIAQASKIGQATAELVSKIIDSKPHPEQGFRAAMGILNLKKQYSVERIEKAAQRGLHFGNLSYKSIKNILAQELDKIGFHQDPQRKPVLHDNIRGQDYYNQEQLNTKENLNDAPGTNPETASQHEAGHHGRHAGTTPEKR